MTQEERLLAIAEKATPGPWESMDYNGRVDVVTKTTPLQAIAEVAGKVTENGLMFSTADHGGADGAFIAALDPQTVILAMRVIKAARKLAMDVTWAARETDPAAWWDSVSQSVTAYIAAERAWDKEDDA